MAFIDIIDIIYKDFNNENFKLKNIIEIKLNIIFIKN